MNIESPIGLLGTLGIVWTSLFCGGLVIALGVMAQRNAIRKRATILPLERCIELLKAWLKEWPDQKLYDVYAFAQDGKMNYHDGCSCILGVYSSKVLHQSSDFTERGTCIEQSDHYGMLKSQPGMARIEFAYRMLGGLEDLQLERDARLLEILGAEMARRAMAGYNAVIHEVSEVRR